MMTTDGHGRATYSYQPVMPVLRLGQVLLLGGSLLLGPLQVRAAEEAASADSAASDTSSTEQTSDLGKVVVRGRSPVIEPLKADKEVPKSISAVSGEELESLDALNVTDVLKRIGNVQWNYGNPKTGSLSIRGVTAGSTEQIDPSLGVNVDGVPYAYVALASALDYVDVATISVLRGPQGTSGGNNTSMGTISVVDNIPSFTPEAHGSVILGMGNAVITQGVAGGPVIDNLLAWRATFYRDQQKGPYHNSFADNKDRVSWDNSDRTLARVQFLLTPSDDFNVLVSVNSKPKGIEYVNGLNQNVQQPYTYADGKTTYIPNGTIGPSGATTATNTIQNKLLRGYFTAADPNAYQNYLNDPVLESDDKGIENGQYGGLVKLSWNQPRFIVQSISGYEYNFFQASNSSTEWAINSDGGLYTHYHQESEELSINSKPGGFLDYTAGLFYLQTTSDADTRARYGADAGAYTANAAQYDTLSANAAGFQLLENSLNRLYTESTVFTDNWSEAAFGNLDWHLSDPLTLTTGLRVTHASRQTAANKLVTDDGFGAYLDPGAIAGSATVADAVAQQYFGVPYASLTTAQLREISTAQSLRASTGFNGLYARTNAQPYVGNLTTGNLSLSYKLSPDLTSYVSWQHGAKPGISQISGVDTLGVPISRLVAPESSNSYELGVKGNYLHNTLTVNADVFLDLLHNYQQGVYILDPVLTAQNNNVPVYTSITGNAPMVEVNGVEIDAAYSGIRNLTIRFAGGYNHAFYRDDILLPQPVENGDLATKFYDAKGQTLTKAPKFTENLSLDYSLPVLGSKLFHANINYHYVSSSNSDASNSSYAWVKGYGLADFGIGIGRRDRSFDVNLIVKNAFNTSYVQSRTWTGYVPGLPRWFGIAFSATLL